MGESGVAVVVEQPKANAPEGVRGHRASVRGTLRSMGLRSVVVDAAHRFASILSFFRTNVVVVDVDDRTRGTALLDDLARTPDRPPAIVISDEPEIRAFATRLGFVLLPSAFAPEQLTDAVGSLLAAG
jgi:DNA-binding NtrC family response regulator